MLSHKWAPAQETGKEAGELIKFTSDHMGESINLDSSANPASLGLILRKPSLVFTHACAHMHRHTLLPLEHKNQGTREKNICIFHLFLSPLMKCKSCGKLSIHSNRDGKSNLILFSHKSYSIIMKYWYLYSSFCLKKYASRFGYTSSACLWWDCLWSTNQIDLFFIWQL